MNRIDKRKYAQAVIGVMTLAGAPIAGLLGAYIGCTLWSTRPFLILTGSGAPSLPCIIVSIVMFLRASIVGAVVGCAIGLAALAGVALAGLAITRR